MANRSTWMPAIGDQVRLKRDTVRPATSAAGHRARVATVQAHLSDVPGGLVLDRPLCGFRCWNVAHVEPARSRS